MLLNLLLKKLQNTLRSNIYNKKKSQALLAASFFLPYRKLREFKTQETMFALIESATWVKRHASFLLRYVSVRIIFVAKIL